MDKLLANVATTLEEELRLIDGLIGMALETRQAILERSLRQLSLLGARQQNAVMRLEITRGGQIRVRRALQARLGYPEEASVAVASMLGRIGATGELALLRRLEKRVARLRELNAANLWLLNKQMTSAKALGHVLDIVRGVDRVYDRDGEVHPVAPQRRVEVSK